MLRLHLSLLLLLKIRTKLDIIPAFEHFRTLLLARASVCIVTQSGELLTKEIGPSLVLALEYLTTRE